MEPVAVRADDARVDEKTLHSLRTSLLAQRKLRGRRFCEPYADAADEWIRDLLAAAVRGANRRDDSWIALIAVGGYGRRELCPGSDLDLILIHDGVKQIAEIADAVWYPIWNSDVHLDHSVRTPKETVGVIEADIKSALSLLNGRHVAGDAELGARVIAESRKRWTAKPRVSLERLRATMEERWAQHGELAFLLEPDVKLSRGGLRDYETLSAAALAAPVIAEHLEDPRMEEARDELLAVRVALHAVTGRRSDRLLLQDQDAVARRLGYADADELLPCVADAGRRISWMTDQVWRRISSWLAGPNRVHDARSLGQGVSLRDDELVFDDGVDLSADTALPLRIAAVAARTGISIAPSALTQLETDATAPPEPWPYDTRDALLDLLACGQTAVPLLETLDHLGVLGRYVGEWHAVRSKPQRNAYHRFTVDRHLFETAAEAASLTRSVHRPDLLLVAAWLHDIGKGFPGDHTAIGEPMIASITTRMGFRPEDVATLALLVREHLLLAETATRRDLSDPATAARVAERVVSIENLELLAALTQADSIATGATSWGVWKATLIDELVIKTRGHLAGEYHPARPPAPNSSQRALMAARTLRVVGEGHVLTVVAPDRAGLLATVAGVLAANGLSVRAATGLSEDGMAVEVYDIDFGVRDAPRWERIEEEIANALNDPSSLEARLEERARSRKLPLRAGHARPAAARVIFNNDETPRATIIEVRAPDGVGVLSRIARTLTASGCDVLVVRALTLGSEIVDTFYVVDDLGQKITDAVRKAQIERAIVAELPREE